MFIKAKQAFAQQPESTAVFETEKISHEVAGVLTFVDKGEPETEENKRIVHISNLISITDTKPE